MENTYTYIARNAQDPTEVLTFTLHDHHLTVGLGNPLEQIETALETESGDITKEGLSGQPWFKPVAISLLERGLSPFSVDDVEATAENGGLEFVAWTRLGGLRLMPIILGVDQVDNPEATNAFVDELQNRKTSVEGTKALSGPLDYWAGWFASSLMLMIGLFAFVRLRRRG